MKFPGSTFKISLRIVGAEAKDMYPFQLVIINAMDGSVIDLTHEVEY